MNKKLQNEVSCSKRQFVNMNKKLKFKGNSRYNSFTGNKKFNA